MTLRPTVHDLTAKTCRHAHETNWSWRPSTFETAQFVEQSVCNCLNARMGLEAWCAHVGSLHRFNATDIFNHDLAISSLLDHQKITMREQWRVLCDLKSYIDQLHRMGHWGNLNQAWNWYSEPPYNSAPLFLRIDDPLVADFRWVSQLLRENKINRHYWALLAHIEDIVVERKGALISIVQNHLPKRQVIFQLQRHVELNTNVPDSEL